MMIGPKLSANYSIYLMYLQLNMKENEYYIIKMTELSLLLLLFFISYQKKKRCCSEFREKDSPDGTDLPFVLSHRGVLPNQEEKINNMNTRQHCTSLFFVLSRDVVSNLHLSPLTQFTLIILFSNNSWLRLPNSKYLDRGRKWMEIDRIK